ncbi:MAG: histidine kinase [Alteromonadaceae bacterium]|nr:histidine kinase [Alteromonadaceae bacterium]
MDPLFKLNTALTNQYLSNTERLQKICLTTAELIPGADRVSVWLFDEALSQITSLCCYDSKDNTYSQGTVLKKSDYQSYFEAIVDNEVVCAAQARTDATTSCFTESYFMPLNIHSLLDFTFHQDFVPKGIICCESIGREVDWQDSDIECLRRISRACSFYFKLEH